MNKINMINKKFGKWTVVSEAPKRKNIIYWNCVCDCGTKKAVNGQNLRDGKTQSCGCERDKAASRTQTTQGMYKTRLYAIWMGIKNRCRPGYKNYGDRGITICSEWKNSFEAFRDWAIANGYSDNLVIDRENNDGNYTPENCRWIANKQNSRNTRANNNFTFQGKTQCLSAWAEEYEINYKTLFSRINQYGWSIEKALTTPVRKKPSRFVEEILDKVEGAVF